MANGGRVRFFSLKSTPVFRMQAFINFEGHRKSADNSMLSDLNIFVIIMCETAKKNIRLC